jgi:chromosome segregation ATPase
MTPEEMQRTMEFIVQQQAQFAASIQKLEEERTRDNGRIARLEDSFQTLVQLAENTESRLDRVESTSSALESKMAALAEAQIHTDERLSALIDIVREDRNGKSN